MINEDMMGMCLETVYMFGKSTAFTWNAFKCSWNFGTVDKNIARRL